MAKRGTLEHPKTKKLGRALNMPAWAALGLLEGFWHWVSRYRPTGFLTCDDIEDCSDTIRFSGDLATVLVGAGWLDQVDGGYYVHDWHDHADDCTKKVLEKREEGFANGSPVRKSKQEAQEANRSRTIREPFANDSRQPKPKPKPKPKPINPPVSPQEIETSEETAAAPPWWEYHDPPRLVDSLARWAHSVTRCGVRQFGNEAISEPELSKCAAWLAEIVPDSDALATELENLAEWADRQRKLDWKDPSRVLRSCLGKREAQWRQVKRERNRDASRASPSQPKSLVSTYAAAASFFSDQQNQ